MRNSNKIEKKLGRYEKIEKKAKEWAFGQIHVGETWREVQKSKRMRGKMGNAAKTEQNLEKKGEVEKKIKESGEFRRK